MSQRDLNETPPTNLSSQLVPDYLAVEVDLVVLSRELTKLVNFSSRIGKQLREFRQLVLEQDSQTQEWT